MLARVSWSTAATVIAVIGAYVALEATGHPIPSWLAGAGALVAGALPALLKGASS
ncbi:MAG TPA: hypothetical protein VE987_08195 [Polyangiaceae bacterium]|nr:hypothetical protein [Polyangiaceae bacterium]